jgi:hypothetical protein
MLTAIFQQCFYFDSLIPEMLCINLKLKPITIFSRNNATPRCRFLFYENGSKIGHAAPFE